MKTNIVRYVSLCLVLLWMGVIFAFSAQEEKKSSEVSHGVVVRVAEVTYPNYKKLNEVEQKAVINKYFVPVRKLAHFSEFFVLGALIFLFMTTFAGVDARYKFLITAGAGALYAVSDELHQFFVSGRSCKALDVLIDTAGVMLAAGIELLIFLKIRGVKGERQKPEA